MNQERVLVVEDEPDLRELLRYNLSRKGYVVLEAGDGHQGLAIARTAHPTLILLDLMLPGIDGLTVCRMLKAEAATRDIPVLMLTAKSRERDVLEGLSCGAVDYVTKPFALSELLARVARHCEQAAARRELQREAARLAETLRAMNRRAPDTERLANLGLLSAELVHEINTITTYVGGSAQLLGTLLPLALADRMGDEESPASARAAATIERLAKSVAEGTTRMADLAQTVLRYASGRPSGETRCALSPAVQNAVRLCETRAKSRVELVLDVHQEAVVSAPELDVEQAVVNLLQNAIDAVLESLLKEPERQGRVLVTSRLVDGAHWEIEVRDNGCGMSPDVEAKLYTPFFSTKEAGKGTGLGLGVLHNLVSRNGGSLRHQTRAGHGSAFFIRLPCPLPNTFMAEKGVAPTLGPSAYTRKAECVQLTSPAPRAAWRRAFAGCKVWR